jgi:hypothetical protein
MAKAPKESKVSVEKVILATLPWSSSSFGKQAEVDGFNPTSGKWETIATVNTIAGIDAEDVASFMVEAVIAYQKAQQNKGRV